MLPQVPTVLVIEDEFWLQADLEKVLTNAGFGTEIVASGEEALPLFISGSIICQALVTDIRLRGTLSGWDVARRIREKEPSFAVIYVTGAPAEEWSSQGVPNSILISKPFAAAQLVTNLLNSGTPPT
ncbi:response regulator [Bradyrhizobium sp.]|uniref:response regulator n=1 Tax=Bradyrhizobium sp. TaxID=376 RepID=UPI001ED77B4D|nr:response regulator [Bradyrhizobium sp.]MBV8920133.1 response regulator [Bradyrhizobium sp.]MBV9981090.1 response regulator [Bradyrhizobium sp.]